MAINPTDGIGTRLARYRRIAGYSAQKLSELTEGRISRGTIARIESGVRVDVTVDELIHLAMALGISPISLALPLEEPFKSIEFRYSSKVSVAELATWFKRGTTHLEIPIDFEGDTEDQFLTAATIVSQDTLDGVIEYNSLMKEGGAGSNSEIHKRREQLRTRLTMLGVDLSPMERYE